MNEELTTEFKGLFPLLASQPLHFALAPNGDDPVLLLSKRPLSPEKLGTRVAKAKTKVEMREVWVGTVQRQEGIYRFDVNEEESRGKVRFAAFRRSLKSLSDDRTLNAKALLKAEIKAPSGVEEVTDGLSVKPSLKARIFGSTYSKLTDEVEKLNKGNLTEKKRKEALAGVQGKSADWLRKNVDRDHEEDGTKRDDVWNLYKSVVSQRGEGPDEKDLSFILKMATRDVVALEQGLRDGAPGLADRVSDIQASLELFLGTAASAGNDGAVDALGQLLERVETVRQGLPKDTPMDKDTLNDAMEFASGELKRISGIRDPNQRKKAIEERKDLLLTLRDLALQGGNHPQALAVDDLLDLADKPWAFEDTGDFKRAIRIDLKQAVKGRPLARNETENGLVRAVLAKVTRQVETDPDVRIDREGGILELASNWQHFVENHNELALAVEDLFKREGEPSDEVVKRGQRLTLMKKTSGDPRVLREEESKRMALDVNARILSDEFDWEAYDRTFDKKRVKEIEDKVLAKKSQPVEVLKDLLDDPKLEGLALGESHKRGDVKKLIVDSLEDLVAKGLDTVYIEHFRQDEHQEMLDSFMDTGVEPPGLTRYLDYQFAKNNKTPSVPPTAHTDVDLRAILHKAWDTQQKTGKKVRIVGIDSMAAKADPEYSLSDPRWKDQRARRMNGLANEVIGKDGGRQGKYLMLLGTEHCNSHEGASKGVPGMAQLRGVPTLTLEPEGGTVGDVKLEKDNPDRRHAVPEAGGKAVLLAATMANVTEERNNAIRHNMPFTLKLQIPSNPSGESYEDGENAPYSLHGVAFEWWERIEVHYNFKHKPEDTPESIARRKQAGEGGSIKAWGDLFRSKPNAKTYETWTAAVQKARAGTLSEVETVVVTDRPAVSKTENSYKKRVLRFRLVARDAYGKRTEVEATQIGIIEKGEFAYSFYEDTAGHKMEWASDTIAGAANMASASDKEISFDLEADLPAEKWGGVRPFLKAIEDGTARDFDNRELDFIRNSKATANEDNSVENIFAIYVGQDYCALPIVRPSERYLEADAPNGGILIALVEGKTVKAMYYTDNSPYAGQTLNLGTPKVPYQQAGRKFVEVPVEVVRQMAEQ